MKPLSPEQHKQRRADVAGQIKRLLLPKMQNVEEQWLAAQVVLEELTSTEQMSEMLRTIFKSPAW